MGIEPSDIAALSERVHPSVRRHTRRLPLLRSSWLSDLAGAEVWLQLENFQVTGSFKVRGALAALAELGERARGGVVASSAGNHGLGLAFAARQVGVPCTVVVPENVPTNKERSMRDLGARVVHAPHLGYDATQMWTLAHLSDLGGEFVSPFDDPAVIAGNGGTLALEILEARPEVDAIVAPCGGGGLLAGLGCIVSSRGHPARIFGVNSEASPAMWASRRDGRPWLEYAGGPTVAEGLEGGVGRVTFPLIEATVDDLTVVPEAMLRRAMVDLARHEHMIVEGAAAAGVAALLVGARPGHEVVVIVTGANLDWPRWLDLLAAADA